MAWESKVSVPMGRGYRTRKLCMECGQTRLLGQRASCGDLIHSLWELQGDPGVLDLLFYFGNKEETGGSGWGTKDNKSG